MSRLVAGMALFLLTSCGREPECVDRLDCGELQTCDEGVCADVECISTTDCRYGEYCEEATHTCESGCDSHDGCLAGEECIEHECVAYECRSTPLDCEIGQVCDGGSGECQDAAGCEPCSGPGSAECGAGQCVDFDPGRADSWHCIQPCATVGDPEACPRGLECRDLSGQGDLFCYADCPVFQRESRDR